MAWQMKSAFVALLTTLLFLIPAGGAASPDYMDNDGDSNSGATNIVGLSAGSDGEFMMLMLHTGDLSPSQATVNYWWDFAIGSTLYRWQCLAGGANGVMSLDCSAETITTQFSGSTDLEPTGTRIGQATGIYLNTDTPGSKHLKASYTLDVNENTISILVPYGQIGANSGSSVDLLEGGARSQSLLNKDANADMMILGETLVLR